MALEISIEHWRIHFPPNPICSRGKSGQIGRIPVNKRLIFNKTKIRELFLHPFCHKQIPKKKKNTLQMWIFILGDCAAPNGIISQAWVA